MSTSSINMITQLPNEIQLQIFEQLDYETICNTREIQSEYVIACTRYNMFAECIYSDDFSSAPYIFKYHANTFHNKNIYLVAYNLESIKAFKYLMNLRYKCDDMPMYSYAAMFGNAEVLQMLYDINCNFPPVVLLDTLMCKHYENIPLLISKSCDINIDCVKWAARHNQFEVIQYCIKKGYVMDDYTFGYATYNQDTLILDQLSAISCKMTNNTIQTALEYKCVPAIMWLLDHKCPLSPDVLNGVICGKDLYGITLMFENNCPHDHNTLRLAHETNCKEIIELVNLNLN